MCLAVPARVVCIEGEEALVDFGGVKKRISLGIVKDVKKGEHLLIHAGFAIGKVKDEEVRDIQKSLKELNEAIYDEYPRP